MKMISYSTGRGDQKSQLLHDNQNSALLEIYGLFVLRRREGEYSRVDLAQN